MAPRKTKKKVGRPAGKKSVGRPKKKSTAKRGPAKKTAARKSSVKAVKKPAGKRGGNTREMDPVTGFAVGTDGHAIAEFLIEGCESRQECIDVMRETLDAETRNGTEKPVANLVSGVINKLVGRGFEIEQSFRLIPPAKPKRAKRK